MIVGMHAKDCDLGNTAHKLTVGLIFYRSTIWSCDVSCSLVSAGEVYVSASLWR